MVDPIGFDIAQIISYYINHFELIIIFQKFVCLGFI